MSGLNQIHWLLFAFTSLGFTGCQAVQQQRTNDADVNLIGSVIVSGAVSRPGEYPITTEGLTLNEVIGAADMIAPNPDDLAYVKNSTVIMLKRGINRIHIPLIVVLRSNAGLIQLSPGDRVVVNTIGNLPYFFRPEDFPANRAFSIGGLAANTGEFQTYRNDPETPLGLRTVQTLAHVQTASNADSASNLIILTRPSRDSIGLEHFYVPFGWALQAEPSLSSHLLILEGDRVEFTDVNRIPVVFSGILVSATLPPKRRDFKQKEVKHQRVASLHDRVRSQVKNFCDSIPLPSISLPSPSLPGLTR